MDHYAYKEKARITRNLREADLAYRAAVRKVRALGPGHSVDTYDSTHVSEPNSDPGSWTGDDIVNMARYVTPRVHEWGDRLPPEPQDPYDVMSNSSLSISSSAGSEWKGWVLHDSARRFPLGKRRGVFPERAVKYIPVKRMAETSTVVSTTHSLDIDLANRRWGIV